MSIPLILILTINIQLKTTIILSSAFFVDESVYYSPRTYCLPEISEPKLA